MDDRPRLLWTDAICINWVDIKDRNQQVALLRDTCLTASQLVVWLGEAADNSHLVFDHLKNCRAKHQVDWTVYAGETREAFLKLCQRPWFFRTPSAQELALSTENAVVMCGQDEDELRRLVKCTGFRSPENSYHPLRGVDGPTHLMHLTDLKQYSSISSVFLHSTFCTADDPRDKPFAVAGLLRDIETTLNYEAAVVDVFQGFTQKMIETTRDINVLHWLGTRERVDGLPSWVPDFSASISSAVLPRTVGSAFYWAHYPSQVLPGIQFRLDSALIIKGRPVEKIRAIAEEMPINRSVTPGTEEFSRILHGWELLATQLLSCKRFPQAISDAFSDTITAYDDNELVEEKRPPLNDYVEDFVVWYQHYGTGVLAEADKAFFDEIEEIQAWIRDIENSSNRSQRDWSYYARRTELACYGRRYFITDQGSMGLAPSGAQMDDGLVFFPGGMYPFTVRRRDGGAYMLIGDCFLYDFDVFGLFEDPVIETQDFVLL